VADYIRAQGYGHDQGRAINCPALALPRFYSLYKLFAAYSNAAGPLPIIDITVSLYRLFVSNSHRKFYIPVFAFKNVIIALK